LRIKEQETRLTLHEHDDDNDDDDDDDMSPIIGLTVEIPIQKCSQYLQNLNQFLRRHFAVTINKYCHENCWFCPVSEYFTAVAYVSREFLCSKGALLNVWRDKTSPAITRWNPQPVAASTA
jgi:hypothetical protein